MSKQDDFVPAILVRMNKAFYYEVATGSCLIKKRTRFTYDSKFTRSADNSQSSDDLLN